MGNATLLGCGPGETALRLAKPYPAVAMLMDRWHRSATAGDSGSARPEGLEPPTFWSVARLGR